MPRRDLVVVGASAGGVEALRDLVRDLPADLDATVLVVLHLPSAAFSALPAILNRAGKLPARTAVDGERLVPGVVLVAPPDHHLVVRNDRIALGHGPKENGHRPAIDPLFRSAARWHGSATVGVILSGSLDDGAAGLRAIAERGGAAVVQAPAAALYDGMPCAALAAVPHATQAAGEKLAQAIAALCREEIPADPPATDRVLEIETGIAEMEEQALADEDRPGRPAAMTCPDCNGAMFELDHGAQVRFRCRVGHAWSPESLLLQQSEAAEAAVWAAIRTLEEKAALHERLGSSASERGALNHRYHSERAAEAAQAASTLRDMLRRAFDAVRPEHGQAEGREG